MPWGLYETVGEWGFYPIAGDPARILDEHWCMSPYYTGRDDYYRFPTYPLKAVNVTLKDFRQGPLENWTTGALHFNGGATSTPSWKTRTSSARSRELWPRSAGPRREIGGADLSNPQVHTSNFLIETYFQTAPGGRTRC